MWRKLTLLPATMILTLAIGGCEEGDFEDDLGEPDVQTETEVIEPDTGAAPPAETPEMEQESELQLDQQPAAENRDVDASTDEPVDVEQDVNVPEGEAGQSAPSESGQGESQEPNSGSDQ